MIILGIAIIPFVVFLVTIFFLYPYLNKENYNKTMDEHSRSDIAMVEIQESDIVISNPQAVDSLQLELSSLLNEQKTIESVIDSLVNKKQILISEIQDLEKQRELVLNEVLLAEGSKTDLEPQQIAQQVASTPTTQTFADNSDEIKQEFSERVKSLLNLEEEELAPILKKIEDQQLLLLYDTAGNIQREKMLRSLTPDRAANLMKKIML